MNIAVLGAATTTFGELWEVSPRSLARDAVKQAMTHSGIGAKDVDALFVGNMLSGILGGQEHLGSFFSEELGFFCPAFKIEGACASGGLAVHAAVTAILSGLYETVVVLGVEKMTDHKPEDVATALMGAGNSEERIAGAIFPGLYALLARVHMHTYGTAEEQLAAVAVKNHYHASLNPKAQYRTPITVEQVMRSSRIADPLKLLDCSPISDGAAAIVLRRARTADTKSVYITASAVATDTLGLSRRESLTELKATRLAARKAYQQAGVDVSDITVAEVHDCFTIAEILAMEDLGLYEKGKAASVVAEQKTQYGSQDKIVVNSSGGLKGCGHPVGATGVKQVVEVYDQLVGNAGKRQVDGARIGLTHNVGGSGATAVVHILQSGVKT